MLLIIIFLAFICLGLPDALLGSAWPVMFSEFGVPISYAGILSMLVSVCTVISSLLSDRLTRKMGPGPITASSVGLTAAALFGYSVTHSFSLLCLIAIPYGLGAGSVDACLNNYVALHYKSQYMSWLHCMWGVGISVGPYIMSSALRSGMRWNHGYRLVSILQIILTACIIISLPLWRKNTDDSPESLEKESQKPIRVVDILRISGAKEIMIAFFCYCALEQTCILWGSSYLVFHHNVAKEIAASFASMFCIGITIGRAISGFVSMKMSDSKMIFIGSGIILLGVLILILNFSAYSTIIGLMIIGFGCAPIYPCVIHSTPKFFGADRSQAVIGMEMASAYVGTTVMPPIFGLLAKNISVALLPYYLLIILILMVFMYRKVVKFA